MTAALLLVATMTVAAESPAQSKASEPAQRPNIILCMADDQGWGDTGYNGHPVLKTPHLDQMAQDGMRFDRFIRQHWSVPRLVLAS